MTVAEKLALIRNGIAMIREELQQIADHAGNEQVCEPALDMVAESLPKLRSALAGLRVVEAA